LLVVQAVGSPFALAGLDELQELDLADNQLSTVIGVLRKLPALRHCRLAGERLAERESGATPDLATGTVALPISNCGLQYTRFSGQICRPRALTRRLDQRSPRTPERQSRPLRAAGLQWNATRAVDVPGSAGVPPAIFGVSLKTLFV